MKRERRVFGVAINDVSPVTHSTTGGRSQPIPSYRRWQNMLNRCYNKSELIRFPTYQGCSVCNEWLRFSKFHDWYNSQYKEEGWHLDKDIILPGNKVYSPETCVFVSSRLNGFVHENKRTQGKYMLGVTWHKRIKKFHAQCTDPFPEYPIRISIGYFDDELEAHIEWRKTKHDLACKYADIVHDQRLAKALRERYAL